jgi:hypothetical protein
MKLFFKIFLIALLFVSCNAIKTNNAAIKFSNESSIYFYEGQSPYVYLPLLGDYKFMPYSTKYFRDIDKKFIQYSTLKFDHSKPTILYSAYTYVQPYYSTICILYKNCTLDSSTIKNIKIDLKESLKTTFTKYVEVKCGDKMAYKIYYQVMNAITKRNTMHTEYLFKNGANVYRIYLWTSNSDDKMISTEAEYIIREAKVN